MRIQVILCLDLFNNPHYLLLSLYMIQDATFIFPSYLLFGTPETTLYFLPIKFSLHPMVACKKLQAPPPCDNCYLLTPTYLIMYVITWCKAHKVITVIVTINH